MEFRNESDLEFKDISSEQMRAYVFDGVAVVIDQPLRLHVSASGGHRIFDASGDCHYIPTGWTQLKWRAKDGSPHFVM